MESFHMRIGTRRAIILVVAAVPPNLLLEKTILLVFINEYTWILATAALLLVMAVGSIVGLLWFRRRSEYYLRQYKSEVERNQAEEALREDSERFLMTLRWDTMSWTTKAV
jgi:hypothetical protein